MKDVSTRGRSSLPPHFRDCNVKVPIQLIEIWEANGACVTVRKYNFHLPDLLIEPIFECGLLHRVSFNTATEQIAGSGNQPLFPIHHLSSFWGAL